MIPVRFQVTNKHFVRLCFTKLTCLRGLDTPGARHDFTKVFLTCFWRTGMLDSNVSFYLRRQRISNKLYYLRELSKRLWIIIAATACCYFHYNGTRQHYDKIELFEALKKNE